MTYQITKTEEHIHSDSDDHRTHLNQTQTESCKSPYFVNSLCTEYLKSSSFPSSSQQSLVYSASRQSLQQALFVLNNGNMTHSA